MKYYPYKIDRIASLALKAQTNIYKCFILVYLNSRIEQFQRELFTKHLPVIHSKFVELPVVNFTVFLCLNSS